MNNYSVHVCDLIGTWHFNGNVGDSDITDVNLCSDQDSPS